MLFCALRCQDASVVVSNKFVIMNSIVLVDSIVCKEIGLVSLLTNQ